MSYPPPPGLHPSPQPSASPAFALPPRPPPAAAPAVAPSFSGASSFAFAPRSVARGPPLSTSAPSIPYTASPTVYSGYSSTGYYPQPYNPSPPQIQNPFPLPGQDGHGRGRGEDPELEAQIAQWQSAYVSEPKKRYTDEAVTGANAGPIGRPEPSTPVTEPAKEAKAKTVVRSGGGQTWQDPSLLEWNPAHFRLFVGNLAGEVTDESLLKAFSRYPSVQKARVVRDKRTTKSKGFGFVSFADGDEYFQAGRDMQGKYIGSHPVLIRRSTTEIRPTAQPDSRKGKAKGGKNPSNGAKTGAGVHKKHSKTKGGLKVLG
ncbi:MAG: hypothetical protein M1819_002408 [Sarea resinae]|nr:MAG: hypothetical protein M1819_002408 [Sarea resinae]